SASHVDDAKRPIDQLADLIEHHSPSAAEPVMPLLHLEHRLVLGCLHREFSLARRWRNAASAAAMRAASIPKRTFESPVSAQSIGSSRMRPPAWAMRASTSRSSIQPVSRSRPSSGRSLSALNSLYPHCGS